MTSPPGRTGAGAGRASARCTSSASAGAGMCGIARILLARGVRVSGSDAKDSRRLAALRALGARVRVGHDRRPPR